jgi:hypothetical protein
MNWGGEKQDISKSFAKLTLHLPNFGPNLTCHEIFVRGSSAGFAAIVFAKCSTGLHICTV